jgi:hypothetical protein
MGQSSEEISTLAKNLAKQYGWKPPSQKGKKYWTNGISNVMSFMCPGHDWRPGKTLFCNKEDLSKKQSEIKKSQMTPQKKEVLRQISLSNGSMPPSQKGKFRWTDGIHNTTSYDCPGPGWYKGMAKRDS